jgi:hypothetical protein
MINETEHKVNEIATTSEEQAVQPGEVMHSIEKNLIRQPEAAAATSKFLAQPAES